MKTLTQLSFLLFVSCSLFANPEREKILKSWEGKTVQDLESHPYFSQVPLKRNEKHGATEVRNYEERGRWPSKARSEALGGGVLGVPSGACQNIFTIKDGIIKKYEMKESCLTDKRKLP